MHIFEAQREILESFKCERFSSSDAHIELARSFYNKRNPHLVEYLNQFGWDEDLENSTAFYIIKSPEGIPLLFFSLKCGSLSQALDESELQEKKILLEIAKEILKNPVSDEDHDIAKIILEKYSNGEYISKDDLKKLLESQIAQKRNFIQYIHDDKSKDPNKHIIRVNHTHSGIELVHICVNESARDYWKQFNMPQTLGTAIYWHFIIPLVDKVRKFVGCKYLFLFAADATEDGTLINYYNVSLHLDRPEDIGTNKPTYDLNCVFMCQEIAKLKKYREDFFNNFNPDETDELV